MSSRAPSLNHRPYPQPQHTPPATPNNNPSTPGTPKAPPPTASSAPPPRATFTINTSTYITGHNNVVMIPNTSAGGGAQAQQARMAAVLASGLHQLPDGRGDAPVELKDQYGVRVVGSGNLVVLGGGGATAGVGRETGTWTGIGTGSGSGTEHVGTGAGEYTAGMSGEKRRRV